MTTIDLDTLRSEVRALDYVRGSPAEDTMWREDDEDARANLAIEGMALLTRDAARYRTYYPRLELICPP